MKSCKGKPLFYSLAAIVLYLCVLFGFKYLLEFILLRDEFVGVNERYIDFAETIVYVILIIAALRYISKKTPLLIKSEPKIPFCNFGLVLFTTIFYRILEDPILRYNVINNLGQIPFSFQDDSFSLIDHVIPFFNLVLLAVTFEELFFRRIILNFFIPTNLKLGVIFSSVLFALIHINGYYFDFSVLITAFTFSIVASIIYLRYNVFYSILFHSSYNFLWYFLTIYKKNYWEILACFNFDYYYWLVIGFSMIFFVVLLYPMIQTIANENYSGQAE